MKNNTDPASIEAEACACAQDPDVKILRRVSTLSDFPLAPRGKRPFRKIALVDCETTGTDPMIDELIDVAVVVVEINADGEIVAILSAEQSLRDPHMPIPAAITMLTGITDDDVRGKVISLDALEARLANAEVRIAHNCAFDLAFLQNLMPGLSGLPWACSAWDISWPGMGFDSSKLGYLLTQIGRWADGHRAMADVVSLLHLLAHRLPDGTTVMSALIANAERPSVRFEATAAPFERRSMLKSRGYRWDGRKKVWWILLDDDEVAEEEHWYHLHIVPHGSSPRLIPVTWEQRHR